MHRFRKRAWILIVLLGSAVALFSLGALFIGVDANEFEQSTGMVWSELLESNPTIASYIIRLERLIGVGYAFTGLIWVALAFSLRRNEVGIGWMLLWTMPAVFAGASIVFIVHDAAGLGVYYAVFTILAVVGLLLSNPSADQAQA